MNDFDTISEVMDYRAISKIVKDKIYIPKIQNSSSKKLVIMIHGWISTPSVFTPMAKYLREEGNFATYQMNLPTTFGSFKHLLKVLTTQLKKIDYGAKYEEVNLIGHSFGGLLTRITLCDHTFPNLKRVVFLNVPFKGSMLADKVINSKKGNISYAVKHSYEILNYAMNRPLSNKNYQAALCAGNKFYDKGVMSEKLWNFRKEVFGNTPSDGTVEVASQFGYREHVIEKKTFPITHAALVKFPPAIKSVNNFLKDGKL